ncbi:diguanylate cyclase, partial [Pseudomonas syringae]
PFSFEEQELILTVSLGVTLYPEHALDFDQLNHHASHALRQAQHLGGNTVQYYAQEKNGSYIQDLNLENELRQAIKNG